MKISVILLLRDHYKHNNLSGNRKELFSWWKEYEVWDYDVTKIMILYEKLKG